MGLFELRQVAGVNIQPAVFRQEYCVRPVSFVVDNPYRLLAFITDQTPCEYLSVRVHFIDVIIVMQYDCLLDFVAQIQKLLLS